MTPGPERNDPCPCGSGRKYKKCCMLKDQASRPLTKELLREASRKAASLLMDFAVRCPEHPQSPPLRRPVPVLPSEEAQHTLNSQLMVPWLLYLWHPPDDQNLELPSPHTIAARFLKQHEEQPADSMTRRFMEAARNEPLSYWQVQAASPGASLLLKDMTTDEERVVLDSSVSRTSAQWDILLAQVVGMDGVHIFNAIGLYPLMPHVFRTHVAEFAEAMKPFCRPPLNRLGLLRCQTEILSHYLVCMEQAAHPAFPELRNMDGEKFVFVESRYSFSAKQRLQVIEALGSMRQIEAEGKEGSDDLFVWVARAKQAGNDQIVSKARIKVSADSLVSECNSEGRDKALRRRLHARFKGVLTYENTEIHPFIPGRHKPEAEGSGPEESRSGALDLSTLPEEARNRMVAMLEQQYMRWLDDKVPMLGGRTPRQVAKTTEGRKQVEQMINDWENMQNRNPNPQFSFDFNKLRQELGIEPD